MQSVLELLEIKITCTNRVFVKCVSLSTYVLIYRDKTAFLMDEKLPLNECGVSFFDAGGDS